MSTKTFTKAPKPARRPTPEEIAAFEETGRAVARERKITAKAERREHRRLVSRDHGNTENKGSEFPPSQKHSNAGEQNGDFADSQKSVEAGTSDAGATDPQNPEAIVRLTIDLPESLHTRFKAGCAMTRRKMVDEVRGFIERRAAELEGEMGRP